MDLTIGTHKDKAVRFGVNMITGGKDKKSKLFGRCDAVKIKDLKV